jgi:hypothetical protein
MRQAVGMLRNPDARNSWTHLTAPMVRSGQLSRDPGSEDVA